MNSNALNVEHSHSWHRSADDVNESTPPETLLGDVIDSMEQGIIVWDADGICELFNLRVFEVLELSSSDLFVGLSRLDFLQMGVERGEFSQKTVDQAIERFKSGEPFSFERKMPSGRDILTSVRPRSCGGFVVTFSDISEMKEKELELGLAKNRAEVAEAELGEQLENVSLEKAELEEQQILLSRLSMVATHAKDIVAITTAEGSVEWVNNAFIRALETDSDSAVGKPLVDALCCGESDPISAQTLVDSISNRHVVKTELLCHVQADRSFWMELEVTPVFSTEGNHTNFVAVGRDTTIRKSAELAAQKAGEFEIRKREEANLLAEFNGWLQSSDSLTELFSVMSSFLEQLLPTSTGAVYVYANSRDVLEGVCTWHNGKVLSNFTPSDCWALRRGRAYFYGENKVDFPCRHVVESHAESLPCRHYCLPIVAHGDTVGLLCIDLPESDDADSAQEIQKLAVFCSEQISLAIANVKLREQLLDQSTRDAVTSLYNRRYFIECMRRELTNEKRSKPASIISLDVDHFKKFNDTFGHDAGDCVLRELSKVLMSNFHGVNTPCRYGGEEFAVFLPGASAEDARRLAEELRLAVNSISVRYSGENLKVTISSGVATFPENGNTVQALIKSADRALYAAKDSGRDNVQHIDDLS